ncbi:hypothetical protein JHK86_033828 [Glycine max]|nr:hypothetical protein JHK86_033828 [Glycine max]
MDDPSGPFRTLEKALNDDKRIRYHRNYLSNLTAAIREDDCNVRGYFVWSFLDNWEWNMGYTVRFGLYYVDFRNKLTRIPKDSVQWACAWCVTSTTTFCANTVFVGFRDALYLIDIGQNDLANSFAKNLSYAQVIKKIPTVITEIENVVKVVYNFLEDEITKILKVADHYSARSNQTLKEREASPIIHLKKLNNWAKIGYYVGIDIAEGSVRLDKVLVDDAPFDICSCQFALHYSWSIEARARQALANVSALLHPGGIFIGTMPDANVNIKKLREAEGLTFGNRVYWVRFDEEFSDNKFKSSSPFGIKYTFHLEDAVDCPKWIVLFHIFKSLAEGYASLSKTLPYSRFSKASIALQRLVLLDYSFKLVYNQYPKHLSWLLHADNENDSNSSIQQSQVITRPIRNRNKPAYLNDYA